MHQAGSVARRLSGGHAAFAFPAATNTQGEIMNYHARTLAIMVSAACTAGCSETITTPADSGPDQIDAVASSRRLQDAGATARWNELATFLADRTAVDAGRMYAYVSLAQFRAAEAAEEDHRHGNHRRCHHRRYHNHLPVSAAIGGASAAVLSSFFPNDVAEIDAALDAQNTTSPRAGKKGNDFAEAVALGREVGAEVLLYAADDRIGLADPGTPPIGPGYWVWNGGPIARGGYRARPFFLASDSEFRSPPPPMFGSPEFLAALGEVRQISDTRTAEQLASAIYWNLEQSPRRNSPFNNKAVELIRRHHVNDAQAAKIMFLMNTAAFDAIVGCFDAKYAYWFIRPPQADPLITLPIGLPPHPSYPSAHSCVSGSMSGVLMVFFPRESASLEGMSQDASLSRLYAGIHYRFDMDAGIALGRAVAAKATAANLEEVAMLP